MKRLNILLFITLALFCFGTTAYAKCQIQYTGKAASMFGSAPRGDFSSQEECQDYRKSRPPFEQNNSKCVGCDEQDSSQNQQNNSSQPLQDRRRRRFQDNNIRQEALREEAEYQETIRQQELKEQQIHEKFNQDKKEMITQLKGSGISSSSSLKLKGGETKLALKTGNIPVNNQNSAGKENIRKAKQRLKVLKTDVSLMQSKLRFYQESLLKNVSTLDQQADEITKRNSKLLDDGAEYLLSVASARFLKLKSKSKFTEKMRKEYEEFLKVIEKYKEIKEAKKKIDWLVNTPNDANKLIDGAEMLAKNSLENIANELYDTEDIPLMNHVAINYKAWTSVGKACVNWIKIKDTNRSNDDYSMAIQDVSLQLQWAMEDINCLSQCVAESHDNCIKKCSR